ncbi:hypothetical protein [Candidatus Pelagibacter sp. RS39]|uniref:hypothetical protein n=1 Tax=Candidatus Pelagibacter sp. RS39 TaxID=1977864 RepID=UPI000A15775B|nr:hypothetical protein [Candidatus Pelagibacter sp. RS39]ARJ47659.1 hypothetical protein B5L73_02370 [Candidatus Pelagibacter sp. RS39]
MTLRFLKISLFLSSFLFLTGFVPLPAVLGPAITAATSGNLAKATAQLVFDNEFKKKTGKSSLGYITEEVSKNNQQNRINKDFKNLIEKRVQIAHQKLMNQNNEKKIIKDFKLLVEKRVELTHKKLIQKKINQ